MVPAQRPAAVQGEDGSKSARLRFRLVREQAELFAIAPQWQKLLRASEVPEAMMDPAWLLVWWRHYGAGVELAVGVLYDGDEIVGLAPLCIRQYVYRFGIVFRRLQFMGIEANERDGVSSEYMGFVARAGYEDLVADRFVALMTAGGFGVWHELVLAGMPSDNRMGALIEATLKASLGRVGLNCRRRRTMSGHYIKLPESWDSYLRSLSTSRRDHIESSLAKFEEWAAERGGWKLEQARTPAEFSKGFAVLMALHEEQWRQDGAFASPRFTAFHRDYIAAMAPSGAVEICWLTVGGQPMVAIYTIRNGKKILAYQYGRSIGLPPRVMVGIVMNALMIKESIRRGDEEFTFLGCGSPYEADFASDTRALVEVRAARPTAREFIRVSLVNARDKFVAAMKGGETLIQPKPAADAKDRAQV